MNGEFYKVIYGRRVKVYDSFRIVVFFFYFEDMWEELKRFFWLEIFGFIEKYVGKMGVFFGKVFICL